MRGLISARPYGARLRAPTNVKIRGLQVMPMPTTSPATWSNLWDDSHYNWAGILKPQIDLAKGLGANTIKAGADLPGIAAGGSLATNELTRYEQFLNYCLQQQLLVYWRMSTPPHDLNAGVSVTDAVAAMETIAALLEGYGNVIAIDIVNELDLWGGAAKLTWMTTFTGALRTVTALPLTYSRFCDSSAKWADSYVQMVEPYTDFHDFHPYYGGVSGTATTPESDPDAYVALGYDRPFLIGEIGTVLSAGASAQTVRCEAWGAISGRDDCFGASYWCIADATSDDSGIYDSSFNGPRTQISLPYASWPAQS